MRKELSSAIILFSAFLLFLFSTVPPATAADRPFLIKFATLAPENSTWMKHMRRLDKLIRQKTDGQVGFRIYAGGIAGDELDVLRKLRIGQIHCAAFSGVGFGQILPMVRILDLPFLFKDHRETDLVHNALQDFFAEHFRENGFELLAWAEVGNVHLFSRSPIQKLEDLAALKVWTWSGDPISKETFTLMGTQPIPLSITDVMTALNTKMVDTVYAPPLAALALQWHRPLQYVTSLPLAHSTGAVLLSRTAASKISAPHLAMLREEFRRAMIDLTSELRNQSDETMKIILESGLNLVPMPEDKELEKFHRIHDQVARLFSGKMYPPELLDRVYKILQRP